MKNYNKLWQLFFAVSLTGLAIQQFIFGTFRPVILPWPTGLVSSVPCVWAFSILLILASAAIVIFESREAAIYMGIIFLLMVAAFHVPFYLQSPVQYLGMWGNAFKLFAYSGGAFVVASSLPKIINMGSGLSAQLEKLLPFGRFLFCTTIVVFGVEHFMYAGFVATLVPAWIPGHYFWTYFAGAALILSGMAIILNIQLRLAANLLGLMIFIWFIILHIPRALAAPASDYGNEWSSVFEALGFSGIAFLIASTTNRSKRHSS